MNTITGPNSVTNVGGDFIVNQSVPITDQVASRINNRLLNFLFGSVNEKDLFSSLRIRQIWLVLLNF